ncbi:MAG: hypothetical protein QOI80_3676 [Solirubrobacteraceae bacterium]|nr:hypothetical protein [Solirubrobacteraceae bacterium]
MPVPDRADVAALLEEARAAGRADALVLLRERWRDAYLEAATAPPPAAGDAWWVYCVAAEPVDVELPGVAGAPVETVAAHGLHAVVSRVPLSDFGDEPLRDHLEDLAWVERVARAHETVLEAAMERTTIVPLRLCTICLARERVADLLGAQAADLTAALERLRGRSEWGVKLFASRPVEADTPVADDDGAAYLERKRRAVAQRERAGEDVDAVHEAIAELAVAAVANPPQHRDAHGRDADMVLNGAYLVEDSRRAELGDLVGRLAGDGVGELELTGPWPPYNFASAAP